MGREKHWGFESLFGQIYSRWRTEEGGALKRIDCRCYFEVWDRGVEEVGMVYWKEGFKEGE